MKRPPQSHLQNKILIHLAISNEPVKSLRELSIILSIHRSSVSRSMHVLKNDGLVTKNINGEWLLTDSGIIEVNRLRENAKTKMETTTRDLGYFSKIATVSISPILDYVQKIGKQQIGLFNSLFETTEFQHQILMNDLVSNQTFREITTKIAEANSIIMDSIPPNFFTVFSEALPNVQINEIITKQSSVLFDAFRNLGTFDSYKNAISASLLNTGRVSALIEAIGPNPLILNYLDTSLLKDLEKTLAVPSITEAIASLGKIDIVYPRLIQEAASFATTNQYLNNYAMNLPELMPNITRQLGQIAVALSHTISDISILRKSQHITDPSLKLFPHITEVTRTQLGLYANGIANLENEHILDDVVIPGNVTAEYVSTVTSIIAPSNYGNEPWISNQGITDPIEPILANIGDNFLAMWTGAWETAQSDNPDRYHQAAHSGRELLMQLLDHYAPDSIFSAEEIKNNGTGIVTHRMQINKIIGGNNVLSRWASAIAYALIEGLDTFTAISHYRTSDPPVNQSQLLGMLITLRGLLIVCFGSFYKDSRKSS